MNKDGIISIIEKAFQCSPEEGIKYTQDQYVELEENILGMLPKDLLCYLPLIMINLLNEYSAGKDVDVRIGDVISTLDIDYDDKSLPRWDDCYTKIRLQDDFAIINREQSYAISKWISYIDENAPKEELSWIMPDVLQSSRKYWEERSKGLIKPSSRPSHIDDDKSDERPRSIL